MVIIRRVSERELVEAFMEYGIWHQITSGSLIPVFKRGRINPCGDVSQIAKYFTQDGQHIATVHYVWSSTGRRLHCDAKDIVLPTGEKLCLGVQRS